MKWLQVLSKLDLTELLALETLAYSIFITAQRFFVLDPMFARVCVCVFLPDIFMNYRGQPTEQTAFADCGYFESAPSTAFAPLPSSAGTTPHLLIDSQLAQVLLQRY